MAKRADGNAYASERKLTRQPTWKLRVQEQARVDDAAELAREIRKLRKERQAEKKSQ